jgi:Acyl-CoA dehydrogenase, N-terminal domain
LIDSVAPFVDEIYSLQAVQGLRRGHRVADAAAGRKRNHRGVRVISNGADLMGANRPSAFDLDAEQRSVLDQADRFARKELYGLSARMDAEEWWPEDAFPKIGDNGLFGVTIPEEYGGAGLDLLAAGLVLQGLARWNHALALSWVAHDNLCAIIFTATAMKNSAANICRAFVQDVRSARLG